MTIDARYNILLYIGVHTYSLVGNVSNLAEDGNVAASTQNQALNAIVFLYRRVLKQPPGDFGEIVRAKKPARLPVVLTVEEVQKVLSFLAGVWASSALWID